MNPLNKIAEGYQKWQYIMSAIFLLQMSFIIMEYLDRNGGIRRYQNEDGTLTTEGKIRYAKSLSRGDKLLDKNKNRSSMYKTAAVKTAARTAAIVALGKGIAIDLSKLGLLSGSLVFAAGPVSSAVMAPIIATGAAFTMRDIYKAVRADRDISESYKAGNIQRKYRKTAAKYGL